MVKHAININKTSNHLSHKTTEHKKNTMSDDGTPTTTQIYTWHLY